MFALPNSFLGIILQLPVLKTRLFTSLHAAKHFLITTLHGPRRKHSLLLSRIVIAVFTDPLLSNICPIFARIGSHENVFIELLPSSGSVLNNTTEADVMGNT
jgi:hypothetical protein